ETEDASAKEVKAKGVRKGYCVGCPPNAVKTQPEQTEKFFIIKLSPFVHNPATGMPYTEDEAWEEAKREAKEYANTPALCPTHRTIFADAYVNLCAGGLTDEVLAFVMEHREEIRELKRQHNLTQAA
ncbi:MAG TPA: hypothetical protein VJW23_20610, partial [Propionibacteriaceae bacterium]|nr:hypothetical protein [Propionibacteriaceae bacterium]